MRRILNRFPRPLPVPKIVGFRRDGQPIYEIRGGAESDGFIPIRSNVVMDASFGLLERDTVLAQLVTTRGLADFRGTLNDTISLRVPAYAVANARDLRSTDARVRSKLNERKVDVTLDTDLQIDIPLSDEELTLDIQNFAAQVIGPGMSAEIRGIEDAVIAEMTGASYANTVPVGATNVDDPDSGVYAALVDARQFLNDARVPMAGRAAVLGSDLEAQALKDPRLARADQSGSTTALRDASIGRLAGFEVYTAPGLDPDKGYAFHRSAYILASGAPVVPVGAPWGETRTANGFSIRIVQVLDSTTIENIVAFDTWIGTAVVTDNGSIDANGFFVPSTDPDDSGEDDLFVRAVELQATS